MIMTGKEAIRHCKIEDPVTRKTLPRIVTTSWDDGDVCDYKVAELLHARKLPGTFYVPITGHHGSRGLNGSELRTLDREGFEIGGHGLSHITLPQCTRSVLVREVESCKHRLEDVLGGGISMFAYPRGRYSSMAVRTVQQAGYLGARTTEMLAQGFDYDPYKMPTTIHVFPHSKSDYLRNTTRAADFRRAWKYITRLWQAESWLELARILFDSTLVEGGVFHVYGHSWEIEELGLWDDLEEILDYVSDRDDVLYLSNGNTLDYRMAKSLIRLEEHQALD